MTDKTSPFIDLTSKQTNAVLSKLAIKRIAYIDLPDRLKTEWPDIKTAKVYPLKRKRNLRLTFINDVAAVTWKLAHGDIFVEAA